LVTGTLEEESLDIHGVIRLHLTNSFGDCAPPSQLPRFKELLLFGPSINRLAGRFFRLQSKRLRGELKDLKKILRSCTTKSGAESKKQAKRKQKHA